MLTTFFVDSTGDVVSANDGQTSLREAIAAAGSMPGPDTIRFAPTIFTDGEATLSLTQFDTGQDPGELGATAFLIDSEITLEGPTRDARLTIQRSSEASEFRLFHVLAGGDLTINNVNLEGDVSQGDDGNSLGNSGGAGGAVPGLGGAIFNEGTLTLISSKKECRPFKQTPTNKLTRRLGTTC